MVTWTVAGTALAVVGSLPGVTRSEPVRPTGAPVASVSEPGQSTVQVPLHKSRVMHLRVPVARISVGNPEIADILAVEPTQVYVLGKALGTTNVVLWDEGDRIAGAVNLEVTHDLETLKRKLHQLLPGEPVRVHSSQESIVLSGEVSSAPKADAALRLAESFAPEKEKNGGGPAAGGMATAGAGAEGDAGKSSRVLNLLQVGGAQQVMLEVKVAEVNRTLVKRLDIQFNALSVDGNWKIGSVGGGATFPPAIFKTPLGDVNVPVFNESPMVGPDISEFIPNVPRIEDKGLFLNYLSRTFLFNLFLDAAKDRGLARILAEPTLVTLTGQQATFLAGGEFPIPVPQDLGRTTIEFKEFGVGLRFVPLVLDSGMINLKVNVTVSELQPQNSLILGVDQSSSNFFVPALAKRSATSTVELKSGETIGIAGMINENLRGNVDKFPGLGDVPVLGMLFRSQEYVQGQTELVIFVTPRLAQATRQEKLRLPTDNFVEPTDREFYLLGQLKGKPRPASVPIEPGEGGTEGPFGHDL
jgi:pilus assembly protein CpaC